MQPKNNARDYVVKIDFTGKRTIVIPSGEVSWADGRWGRRAGTERFGYDVVRGIAMGFGYVPAKVKPQVKVENLQLREDHPSRLVNPVIVVGAGEIQIAGEVESGQYTDVGFINPKTFYETPNIDALAAPKACVSNKATRPVPSARRRVPASWAANTQLASESRIGSAPRSLPNQHMAIATP